MRHVHCCADSDVSQLLNIYTNVFAYFYLTSMHIYFTPAEKTPWYYHSGRPTVPWFCHGITILHELYWGIDAVYCHIVVLYHYHMVIM